MAKKAPKPKRSTSSSSALSATANSAVQNASDERLVLRIKSGGQMSSYDRRRSSPARGGRKKTKWKGKIKADSKMPKKPPTAFFFFLEDFRKEFQVQNPNVKSMRDVGKACGEKWKTMTYEEKVKYYDVATEKRAEFDGAMAAYLKRKESGEDEEDEEEGSESDYY